MYHDRDISKMNRQLIYQLFEKSTIYMAQERKKSLNELRAVYTKRIH